MGDKNKKKLWIIGFGAALVLALVVYAVVVTLRPTVSPFGLHTEQLIIGQNTVVVEIADTDSARAKGLMMRTFLLEGQGMLFVWPEAAPRTMWMKDTFIPLDIVFIDGQGNIINIIPNATPHDLSPLEGGGPAKYVLELPAGDASRLQMAVGQTIVLP